MDNFISYPLIWKGNVSWKNLDLCAVICSLFKDPNLNEWRYKSDTQFELFILDSKIASTTTATTTTTTTTASFISEEYCRLFFGSGESRRIVTVIFGVNPNSNKFMEHLHKLDKLTPRGIVLIPQSVEKYHQKPIFIDLKFSNVTQDMRLYKIDGWILTYEDTGVFLQYLTMTTVREKTGPPFYETRNLSVSPQQQSLSFFMEYQQYLTRSNYSKYFNTLQSKYNEVRSYQNYSSPFQFFNQQTTEKRTKPIKPIAIHAKAHFEKSYYNNNQKIKSSDPNFNDNWRRDYYIRAIKPPSTDLSEALKPESSLQSSIWTRNINKENLMKAFIAKVKTLQLTNDGEEKILDFLYSLLCQIKPVMFDHLISLFQTGEDQNLLSHNLLWKIKSLLTFIQNENPGVEVNLAHSFLKCSSIFRFEIYNFFSKQRDINQISTNNDTCAQVTFTKKKEEEKVERNDLSVQIFRRYTIGLFSGNFCSITTNFNAIILSVEDVHPSFFCVFIPMNVKFFSWENWKDDIVLLEKRSETFNEYSLIFRISSQTTENSAKEGGSSFKLCVEYIDHPFHFKNYLLSQSNQQVPCLFTFSTFFLFFQNVERIHRVEPIIMWKPIILDPQISESKQINRQNDPFYGLLMTVFGNRVYGLSFRKRIEIEFLFRGETVPYQALIFNNNVLFIPKKDFLDPKIQPQVESLIFGSENFEIFLIKTKLAEQNNILKLKLPFINSGSTSSLRETSVPNILIKAKILNEEQLSDVEALRKEIFAGESFIVERKQPLKQFMLSLNIRAERPVPHQTFKMVRKIRAIAQVRVNMKTIQELIIFYMVPLDLAECTEQLFIENLEEENLGSYIDILVAPQTENMMKLVFKSNFNSPISLQRKDKTTWSMETHIQEHIRCLGRVIISSHKNRIWEAINSNDIFFSNLQIVRNAFKSCPGSKTPYIKAWKKLLSYNESEEFTTFHQEEPRLETWTDEITELNDEKCLIIEEPKSPSKPKKNNMKPKPNNIKKKVVTPLKKVKVSPEKEKIVESERLPMVPLKKRQIVIHEKETLPKRGRRNSSKMENKCHLKVLMREQDRIEADKMLETETKTKNLQSNPQKEKEKIPIKDPAP